MLDLPPLQTSVALGLMTLGTIIFSSVFLGYTRRALDVAQRRLVLQAWQLRQLVPDEAQPSTQSPSTPR
jgi:hypothetical protein